MLGRHRLGRAWWLLLATFILGCAAEPGGDSESYEVAAQAVVGQQTFLYLQCNATAWIPNSTTRLVAGTSSGTWTLTYNVTQAWMTTGSDTCTLVETNQLDGWGTQQKYYDKSGVQLLTVPAAAPGPGQYVAAIPGQDYRFNVKYPATGRYRMTVNWQTKAFTIERVVANASGWLWPVTGQDGKDWVINNYVDLDRAVSVIRDYRGETKSYDNHLGTDIDIPSFRDMDLGHPIIASSSGQVIEAGDGYYDRNTSCQGDWNHVTLQTDDGYFVTYGHLKRGSLLVGVGSHVNAGSTLAFVGSSGCSTWPHLHLEVVRVADGALMDPFRDGFWASPPVYNPPLTLLDSFVTDHEITSSDTIANPPANATAIARGGWIAIGLNAAGGSTGDHLGIVITQSNGATFQTADIAMPEAARHTMWWYQWTIGSDAPTGSWTVKVLVNNVVSKTYTVQVN